jgi:hypothetical protein
MAEGGGGGPGAGGGDGRVLLLVIVRDRSVLDELVTALLDLGVAGTMVESEGLMAMVREEMPVFSGLAALIPERTGSRIVVSATTRKLAAGVFEYLANEVRERERPIALTVPIEASLGLDGGGRVD